jgi:hypothetical protein
MMPVVRVSDHTWARLQQHARPFEDKPEDIINLALDSLERELGMEKKVLLVPASPRTVQKREVGGQKLPQKEFRAPLIATLQELDGSAHVSEIKPVLEKKVEHLLGEADFETVTNGDPRWWNAACWERDAMVKDGILASGSKRGHWELSEMVMRSKEELDAMAPAAFSKWAFEHLAIDKPDFRPVRLGHPSAVADDMPVRIEKMLEQLKTTQGGLVHMVKTGQVVRPRRLPDGDVEWTRSELMAALPMRDRR